MINGESLLILRHSGKQHEVSLHRINIIACPSRDVVTSARQAITIEWWETYRGLFDVFISELVFEEIGTGDLQAASNRLAIVENIPILVATDNAMALAKALILANAIFRPQAQKMHYISVLPLCKV